MLTIRIKAGPFKKEVEREVTKVQKPGERFTKLQFMELQKKLRVVQEEVIPKMEARRGNRKGRR